MCRILLTQGKQALVDDADFAHLRKWRWHAHREGRTMYALRHRRKSDGSGPALVYMHREVLRPQDGMETDHINGDGLDNRRENLRAVTPGINQANQIHQQRGRTLPMGVTRHRRKFRANIRIDGHQRHLGTYATPEEASTAYRAAREERIVAATA